MPQFTTRIAQLHLPKGQYVVIGSGLLDILGLRGSHDVDLAVSDSLFQTLLESGKYELSFVRGAEVLIADDVEIWRNWYQDAPYAKLKAEAIEIEGIAFAHPKTIIRKKRERGLPKDLKDIELLKEYYHYE